MFIANIPYLGASLLIVLMTTIGIFIGDINKSQAIIFYIIGFNELLSRVAQVIKVNTPRPEQPCQNTPPLPTTDQTDSDSDQLEDGNMPPPFDVSEILGMFGNTFAVDKTDQEGEES